MKRNLTERELLNIIIVHTSRTWERIRLQTIFEEMPKDNIESVEDILEIADEISKDDVLQRFLTSDENWDWETESGESFSDTYIEGLAEKVIKNNYILNLQISN